MPGLSPAIIEPTKTKGGILNLAFSLLSTLPAFLSSEVTKAHDTKPLGRLF